MNFKCKKIYPGGPDIGYVSKPHATTNDTPDCHYYRHNWFNPAEFPEFWDEVKEPMVTTEDGMKLFEGDLFYPLNMLDFSYGNSNGHILDLLCDYNNAKSVNIRWFSSKQSRDKYIEENKTRYSKKDMLSIIEYSKNSFVTADKESIFYLWNRLNK